MGYDSFFADVKKLAEDFRDIPKEKTIRVISHIDSDGICAAAIFTKLILLTGRKYSLSMLSYLDEEHIDDFREESYEHYFFIDLGSGHIENIAKKLSAKNVFVLDHHEPESRKIKGIKGKIKHLNPLLYSIDHNEISGSGIAYLFSREADKRISSMPHIAVIGAIGDAQEDSGFAYLNNTIYKEAKKKGLIEEKTTIKIFGSLTRPLVKLLYGGPDPAVPGITNETKAMKFLKEIGIRPRNSKGWRTYPDLSRKEADCLIKSIAERRDDIEKEEDLIGMSYMLPKEEGVFMDAREFSTILNACGRLGKASIGIGVCLSDTNSKKKAIKLLSEYRKELITALNWYRENKNDKNITEKPGFMIINAQDNISSTIIGTITSILAYSSQGGNRYIIAMAQNLDGKTTKASIRASGRGKEIDVCSLMKEITPSYGECGGHKRAAGAIIPTDKEEDFIKKARFVLERYSLEEKVL